jgi:hypothetical protein
MPKSKKCIRKFDEHQGYKNTGQKQSDKLPHKTVVWEVWKCQCGARTQHMRPKTK